MEQQNAIEDLAFIKKIINESRQSVIYGWSFLIWGILISIGLISTYITVQTQAFNKFIDWIWIGLIIVGWLFSGYDAIKKKKVERKLTFVDKVTGAVWLAFGISATILGLIGMFTPAYNGAFISPIISTIVGSAYYVTGVIHRTTWLRNLSFGWWAGAIVMFIWPGLYILLLMAAMMLLMQVLPGLILQRQTKRIALENYD